MDRVSVNLITWNEEEMLPWCLTFLNSLSGIDDICVVDSQSTDRTPAILAEYGRTGRHPLRLESRAFDGFGAQRQRCLDLATSEWVLLIDADETYSQRIDQLLTDLQTQRFPGVVAVRIPTLVLVGDRRHIIGSRLNNLDPHVRLFRRSGCGFEGLVHEGLTDGSGRALHGVRGPDVLDTLRSPEYANIYMKHAQLLKSDASLCAKGERWDRLGILQESARRGIPVNSTSWLRGKHTAWDSIPIRPEWEDVTTNMEAPRYA